MPSVVGNILGGLIESDRVSAESQVQVWKRLLPESRSSVGSTLRAKEVGEGQE